MCGPLPAPIQIFCKDVPFFTAAVVKWTKDFSDLTILEMLDLLHARILALHEQQLRIAAGLAEAKQRVLETRELFKDAQAAPKKVTRRAKRHTKKKAKPKTKSRSTAPEKQDESRSGKRQVLGKSLAQLRAGSKRPAVTTRLLRTSARTDH